MKEHLAGLFAYNDGANRKLLETIRLMPQKEEAVRLFSHLVTSQDKWLNRVSKELDDESFAWYGEIYLIDSLEQRWTESYAKWQSLLENSDSGHWVVILILSVPSIRKL